MHERLDRSDLPYLLVILLISVISLRKLLTPDPIIYYDFSGIVPHIENLFSTWAYRNIGEQVPINYYSVFSIPLLLLGNNIASNLWILLPIPISGISMYVLCRRNTCSPMACFTAAFIYMFNPVILDRFLSAHVGILVGYALFPLVLLLTQSMFEDRSLRATLLLAIVVAFTSSIQSQFLYLSLFLIISYGSLEPLLSRSFQQLVSNAICTGGMIFVTISLMLPTVIQILLFSAYHAGPSLINIHYVHSLSTNTEFLNMFRLIGQSGSPFIETIYLDHWLPPAWVMLGFVVPIFAYISIPIVDRKYRKLSIIIAVIGLMCLVLSTGTMYFSHAYEWLYFNFPFFYAFREPSKFLIPVCLTYSLLTAICLDSIRMHLDKHVFEKRSKMIISRGVILLLIISQAIFVWPMFTGDNELYTHHPKYDLSSDYRDTGEWISSHNGFFRVAVLPYDGFICHTWQWVSDKPIIAIGQSDPHSHKYLTYIFDLIENKNIDIAASALGYTSTKYVVIKNADTYPLSSNDWNFVPSRYKTPPSTLNELFSHSDSFKKVKTFGGYTIYENLRFMEHVRFTPPPILVVGDRSVLPSLLNNSGNVTVVYANQLDNLKQNVGMFENVVIAADLDELVFEFIDQDYILNPYDVAENPGTGQAPKEMIMHQWIRSDIFEYVEGGIVGAGALPRGGRYAITRGDALLDMEYDVTDPGSYDIWVHILCAPDRGALNLSIGNNYFNATSDAPEYRGFQWFNVGTMELNRGTYEIFLENTGGENAVDGVAIVPVEGHEAIIEEVSDVLDSKHTIYLDTYRSQNDGMEIDDLMIEYYSMDDVVYEIEHISPTKYIVHYNATAPFMMVLAESYHPLWEASLANDTIAPMMVNSYSNGFFIEGTLNGTATIEFTEQRTIEQALMVSGLFLLCMLGYLFFQYYRRFFQNKHDQ
ncbi:MAG: hypothetical protein K8R64_06665 [Methanosarcinaceae archaeon]|nr:hypothetical protein [Methanosarcinaceae archaeon]